MGGVRIRSALRERECDYIALNMRLNWSEWPRYAVLALVLSLMLVEWLRGVPVSPNTFLSFQELRDELIGLTLERTSQTCGVVVLCVYHLSLLWVKTKGTRHALTTKLPWWPALDLRDWFKFFLVLGAVLRFAAGWNTVPVVENRVPLITGIDQSTNALVFLAGIVLSQAVEALMTRDDRNKSACGQICFIVLIAFLAVASLARHEGAFKSKYRGELRATGLWVNPNTYGLLMGIGLVLSLAYLSRVSHPTWKFHSPHETATRRSRRREEADSIPGARCPPPHVGGYSGDEICGPSPRCQPNEEPTQDESDSKASAGNVKWIPITLKCLCAAAAALLVAGLLRSYSRGAWLATLLGTIYFAFHTVRAANRDTLTQNPSSRLNVFADWVRRNFWVGIVACVSLLVLLTFRTMDSEHLLVKRAVSAANANDFSWRNRLTAWEGALQIMADHPFIGVGWHRIGQEFENFYAPPKLAEHLSIILNDYLTLGMALGIPALLCFVALVWISFRGPPIQDVGQQWIVTASRSALIILLVGFWFDGGLFKLSLATPFWLFLEMAAPRERDSNAN